MVTNIIHFKFKQEKLEEAKEFIKRSIESHKREKGLLRYESYFDNTHETKFCHIKQFESKEALDTHNKSTGLQEFINQLMEYVEIPPAYTENTRLYWLKK